MPDRQLFNRWVEWSDLDEDEFINGYVEDVELGSFKFVELFQEMRPYVEDEQDLVGIARALSFLPQFFKGLLTQNLPVLKSDKELILAWLCHRVKNESDEPTLRAGLDEVVDSIKIISSWGNFTAENAVDITTAIFALGDKMTYKDLKTTTRANLLSLVTNIFTRYDLRLSSRPGVSRFVDGLLNMAQFEKTPQCLDILFPLYVKLTKVWALELESKKLAERIFTSFYRFFPVDVSRNFSQKPGMTTMQDLSEALEECITCHPMYADFAFEQLLGNLDSQQVDDSKKKTLAMMRSCVPKYKDDVANKWATKLWDGLKYEIWQGSDREVVQASLDILHAVAKTLVSEKEDWSDMKTILIRYITQIGNECNAKTQDSLQWLIPNGQIFHALATSSLRALWYITKATIPTMNLKWQDLSLTKDKAYLLISLNEIIRAHVEMSKKSPNTSSDPKVAIVVSALEEGHDKINSMYDEGLQLGTEEWKGGAKASVEVPEIYLSSSKQEDLLVRTAVEGLAMLIDLPEFYSELTKARVIKSIVQVHSSTVHEDTRMQCVGVLQTITSNNPSVFANAILPTVFNKLPNQINYEYESADDCDKKIGDTIKVLQELADIACNEVCQKDLVAVGEREQASGYWHRNFDALVHKLLLKLDEVVTLEKQLDYAYAIVLTIHEALEKFEKALDKARASQLTIEPKPANPDTGPYAYLVSKLFEMLDPQQQRHEPNPYREENSWFTAIRVHDANPLTTDRLVALVGKISLVVLRSKTTTDANNFLLKWNRNVEEHAASALSSLFTGGNLEYDMHMLDHWQADVRFGPQEKCLANVLSMYMIAGTHPKHRSLLRIDIREACIYMIKAYIGFDIEAAPEEGHTPYQSWYSDLARTSMLWYMQLCVNKFRVAKESVPGMRSILDILTMYVDAALDSKNPMERSKRGNILPVLSHFCAASLAMFDIETSDACLKLMMKVLENQSYPRFGMIMARLYKSLLEPSPILKRENFCNIRSVTPGWAVANIVPRLRMNWQAADFDAVHKPNYLIALAGLIKNIDSALYIEENGGGFSEDPTAGPLLPVIIEGTLIQADSPSKLVYIKALTAIIKQNTPAIEQHLNSIIRNLTGGAAENLDRDHPYETVDCRVAAIEALKILIKYVEGVKLRPFRQQIAKEIADARTDESSRVRDIARQVSVLWNLVLHPAE
ncbi:uncharacterized protein PAC_03999 [Phialocephala subalpina]|uniref:MMS19 nucleotide excision repair protein n=1 Tax=Phialocephala subalpina TaxID=576137 RepID=A0A1L7WMZ2_9HELO|nr:uncharacterized protein PAC_03999 [Phialocephala subalpina]